MGDHVTIIAPSKGSLPQGLVDMLIPRAQGGGLPAPTDDYWYESRGRVRAGQPVTNHTMLTFSGAWAATNAYAGLFGAMPLKSFKKTANGREEATKHATYKILSREPNPEMDSFVFWEMMTQWWINYGNAFAEIQRLNDSDRLYALHPIHPTRVRPERDGSMSWTGRWLIYGTGSQPKYLDSRDMLNIVGNLSDDGLIGKGVLTYAAQAIGVGLAQSEYMGDFYANGGRPSGVLEHPSKLGPDARDALRREWREIHGKANEVAVLWEGMKFNPTSVSPEHAELTASLLFSIQEMSRFYDLPPHMLYELSSATFANVEQMNRFLTSQPLHRRMVRVEKALDRQLFTESEKDAGYYTKFNVNSLLRGDPQVQATVNQIKLACGVINQDEWREQDEQNKLPDGTGSHYWMRRDTATIDLILKSQDDPAQSQPIPGTPPTPNTPPTPPGTGADNRLSELRATVRQMAGELRASRRELLDVHERHGEAVVQHRDTLAAVAEKVRKNFKAKKKQYKAAVQALADQLESKDRELTAALTVPATLTTTIDSLRTQVKKLGRDHDAALALAAEAESIAARAEAGAAAALKTKESELQAALKAHDALNQQVIDLEAANSALQSTAVTFKQEQLAQAESSAQLLAERDTLASTVVIAEQVAADSAARAERCAADATAQTERADSLAVSQAESLRQHAETKKQLTIAERQQEKAAKRAEGAEMQVNSLQTVAADAEAARIKAADLANAAAIRLDAQAKSHEAELEKSVRRSDELKSRCDTLSSELGALRAERDAFRSQVESIATLRDGLAASLEEANKRVQSAAQAEESSKTAAEHAKTATNRQLDGARLQVAACLRTLLDQSLEFLLSQERHEVNSAVRKPEQFKQITASYYHHFGERLLAQLSQAADSLEKLGGTRVDVAKIVSQYVSDSRTRVNNVFHSTKREDLRPKIRAELDTWESRKQTLLNWIGE